MSGYKESKKKPESWGKPLIKKRTNPVCPKCCDWEMESKGKNMVNAFYQCPDCKNIEIMKA